MQLLRPDGSLVCEVTNVRTYPSAEGTMLEGDVPMVAELGAPDSELILDRAGERQRFVLKSVRHQTPYPGHESAVLAARVRGVVR